MIPLGIMRRALHDTTDVGSIIRSRRRALGLRQEDLALAAGTGSALAQRFGLSAGNDFGLLAAIGRDCAGAVAVAPSGERPSAPTLDEVR